MQKAQGVSVTRADLCAPAAVLAAPGVREVIDPAELACVIAAMVLHFMPPDEAAGVAAGYMRRLAPGSVLVVTAGRNEDPDRWEQVRAEWEAVTAIPLYNFSRAEFAALFADLEFIAAPGPVAGPRGAVYGLGGTGRKT